MSDLIRQAILAGVMVGIGVVANVTSPDRYIGAMLFSLALLTIIKCGLKLYTGKIGFFSSERKKDLAVMLLFNLFGALIPTAGIAWCREEVLETIRAASAVKFGNGAAVLFLYGLFCGTLMFVAVYAKETVITVFCIMVFILSGYEHCIADFIYLAVNFSWINGCKFLAVIAGNSAGSIAAHYLMAEQKEIKRMEREG